MNQDIKQEQEFYKDKDIGFLYTHIIMKAIKDMNMEIIVNDKL